MAQVINFMYERAQRTDEAELLKHDPVRFAACGPVIEQTLIPEEPEHFKEYVDRWAVVELGQEPSEGYQNDLLH